MIPGQEFGGDWTVEKLERVRKYLCAYTRIMSKQHFRYAYIDAFAGTGYVELTEDWYEAFYRTEKRSDLFGEVEKTERVATIDTVGKFFVDRLKEIFAGVADNPLPLYNRRRNPLFLLCFASRESVRSPCGKANSTGYTWKEVISMAAKSSIEWTQSTWNPVTGCSKISPGCKHCYAERMARRLRAMGHPNYVKGFEVAIHETALEVPLGVEKTTDSLRKLNE